LTSTGRVAERLRDLADSRRLGQSIDALCASYVHLHLNRLGSSASESTLLGLLRRTRDSLARAPVA
jgi:hypothetical protein